MNTIFDSFDGNVDLSIFKPSNEDPKTPLRRRYLSLVGLLEYVDIINGDLDDRELPEGITEQTVKGMVAHSIGDLDTVAAMTVTEESDDEGNQGAQGDEGNQGAQGDEGNQGAQGDEGNQGAQGDEGNQGAQEPTDEPVDEGTQGTQEPTDEPVDEGTQGTQGAE